MTKPKPMVDPHCARHRTRQIGSALLELSLASTLGALLLAGLLSYVQTQLAASARVRHTIWTSVQADAALTMIRWYAHLAGAASPDNGYPAKAGVFGCAAPFNARYRWRRLGCPQSDRYSDAVSFSYDAERLANAIAGDPDSRWGEVLDCQGWKAGLMHSSGGDGYVPVAAQFRVAPNQVGGTSLFCTNGPGVSGNAVVDGIGRLRVRYRLLGDDAPRTAEEVEELGWWRVRALDVCVLVIDHAASSRHGRQRRCDEELQSPLERGPWRAFEVRVALQNPNLVENP